MGIYVTRDDLLATDGALVWNMAIDKSTEQLDEAKIETAIDDADAEINSFLSRIPRHLKQITAKSLSFQTISVCSPAISCVGCCDVDICRGHGSRETGSNQAGHRETV